MDSEIETLGSSRKNSGAFRLTKICKTESSSLNIVGYILLFIHLLLGIWGIGGFLEMTLDDVPWKPFTNPAFPDRLLLFHWGSVLFASVIFSYGYLTHWSQTPKMMILAYSLTGIVCIVETFGFMTSDTKYLAMIAEFTAYILILSLLYKSNYFANYFN